MLPHLLVCRTIFNVCTAATAASAMVLHVLDILRVIHTLQVVWPPELVRESLVSQAHGRVAAHASSQSNHEPAGNHPICSTHGIATDRIQHWLHNQVCYLLATSSGWEILFQQGEQRIRDVRDCATNHILGRRPNAVSSVQEIVHKFIQLICKRCLLYTSPSPRDS